MTEAIYRFDNHDGAERAWSTILGAPWIVDLRPIWLDYIGIVGDRHIVIIGDTNMVKDICDIVARHGGIEVGWPSRILESITEYRRYLWDHGVRSMEAKYSPGLRVLIKSRRELGVLI